MKKRALTATLLLAVSMSLVAFDLPKGWITAGDQVKSYEMGVDKGAGPNGNNAATIQSKEKSIKGFGTLMQQSVPDKYRGKRVKMSGYLKSSGVSEWAGLWFRVDGTGSNGILGFDNMENRAVKGTTDWKRYEIVLDVPEGATNLAYGALLSGPGQIWFDDINFEVVTLNVPSTNLNK
jgi:hypothetical protein